MSTDDEDGDDEPEVLVPLGRVLDAIRLGVVRLYSTTEERDAADNYWAEQQDRMIEDIVRRRRRHAIEMLTRVVDRLAAAVTASDDRLAFLREMMADDEVAIETDLNQALKQEHATTVEILKELMVMAEV